MNFSWRCKLFAGQIPRALPEHQRPQALTASPGPAHGRKGYFRANSIDFLLNFRQKALV